MEAQKQFLKIREASFEDYHQIASLESRHGLEVVNQEEWKHLWIDNPVYNELRKSWAIGWVLENGEKHIVGSLGNIPIRYVFKGQQLTVSTSRSWVVDSSYRSYALLLLENYFAQKNVDLFINSTVNSQAYSAYTVFQALRVPAGAWDQSVFWITHRQGFTASFLAMKAFPLAKPLSYPLSLGLFLKGGLRRKAIRYHKNGVEIEPCINFDDRFDIFWESLKRNKSQVLLGVRTREMLEWHFRYALLQKKVWILAISKGSHLSAYAIFCRQDNTRFGLKRMRLVDFQALDEDISLLLPMLSWALDKCQHEGIHMLEIIGLGPEKRNVIETLACRHRKLPSWLYFYNTKSQGLAESLKDPKVWDPSSFDGDSSL
jgi:hypothetical protein